MSSGYGGGLVGTCELPENFPRGGRTLIWQREG
jgi:hypothetical protein